MARAKRDFAPADPERITMYVCGPTVYARAHIGNARPAVVFDVLAQLLRHQYGENSLVHAANVTDVEDKIMAAAAAEGVPIETVTGRYSDFYFSDLAALGVAKPDVVPFATQHIPQMVAMIERLIEAGHAYEAKGHVLFDVPGWSDYGRLSRRPMDEMIAGARVEVAPYKRSPADFVLWKPSAADQPGWDSPWGRGRPGWHIECSAMIEAHLGTTIDIHGGGIDLEFPHHENEIAQSSCAHAGAPLANFWLHNGMLSMAAGKMSKSEGNVVSVGELLAQGHKGLQLRYALLMGHYRQPLEWSERLVSQAQRTLDRLRGGYRNWVRSQTRLSTLASSPSGLLPTDRAPSPAVVAALSDDLNTPEALAAIASQAKAGDWGGVIGSAELLGFADYLTEEQQAPGTFGGMTVDEWIAERAEAKARRDFAEADRIRAELAEEGIVLEDGPDGTSWRRA